MKDSATPAFGFHHIGLKAADFEKSRAFYRALGMREVLSWGEGERSVALFEIGDGGKLEIFANGGEAFSPDGKWIHLALFASDVDAAYAAALAAGAEPLTPPKTVELSSRPRLATIRIAFVKGPDGEQIEFFREEEDRRK